MGVSEETKEHKNTIFLLKGLVKETGYAHKGTAFVFPSLQVEVGMVPG